MDITKGVFESTISLLLDIAGKMKDGLNAHKDLQVHGIREELHPQESSNGKVYLPPAATPSQMRRKEQYASVCAGSESPQDSQQIKRICSPCQN
jgi:hypothetical protein